MTDFIPPHNFDQATLEQRLELFRYTDLTQPLIQVLFAWQLPAEPVNQAD